MLAVLDPRKVFWKPIEGTTQERAISAPVNELLLTGGRGWGKTELQLMRFRSRVGVGYGSHWRGVIFDREYKNLDDLVVKSERLFTNHPGPKARWLSSNSAYKWVWETGEELLFRQAKKDADYWSYHGHEYPYLGWNELTKYPTAALYYKMLSVNRSGFQAEEHTEVLGGDNMVAYWNADPTHRHYEGRPFRNGDYMTYNGKPLPPIPLEVVSTTNPYGAGHNWVKSEFIDVAPFGDRVKKTQTIYNPATQQDEEITRTSLALHGTFKENRYLSPQYIAGLYRNTDANILKAWIDGDWDIVAGGAFDDLWRRPVHVVERFPIPKNWYIDRAMDWGSSHPYSVGWFAESNGEEVVLPSGKVMSWPRGTLIQFAELYGTEKIGTNIGVKLSAGKLADKILAKEAELLAGGWISRTPYPGPADNQISNVTESDTETIEKKMADKGVLWERSDKSNGSRANGMELFRNRLEALREREGPGIAFMSNCVASISTIPVLPRDEDKLDDVDTDAEDHPYDMVRYRVLRGNMRSAVVIPVNFAR